MSKFLLVIDLDDELLERYENFDFYVDYELKGKHRDCNYYEHVDYIKGWQQLKPLPKKDFYDEAEAFETKEKYIGYIEGWTDCIYEILKGEK